MTTPKRVKVKRSTSAFGNRPTFGQVLSGGNQSQQNRQLNRSTNKSGKLGLIN